MSDGGKGFGPKGSDAGSKGKGMMKGWLMEMMAAWKGKSKGSGGFDGSPPVAEAPIVDPKGMPKGPASVKGEGLPTAQHAKGKSKGPDDLDGLPTAPEAPKDPKGQSKGSASVKGEGLPTKGKGGVVSQWLSLTSSWCRCLHLKKELKVPPNRKSKLGGSSSFLRT